MYIPCPSFLFIHRSHNLPETRILCHLYSLFPIKEFKFPFYARSPSLSLGHIHIDDVFGARRSLRWPATV